MVYRQFAPVSRCTPITTGHSGHSNNTTIAMATNPTVGDAGAAPSTVTEAEAGSPAPPPAGVIGATPPEAPEATATAAATDATVVAPWFKGAPPLPAGCQWRTAEAEGSVLGDGWFFSWVNNCTCDCGFFLIQVKPPNPEFTHLHTNPFSALFAWVCVCCACLPTDLVHDCNGRPPMPCSSYQR